MQERRNKWVLEESLYDSTPRVVSPWSGRNLPLRAFLQACFVWYGLFNFWLLASTRARVLGDACEIGLVKERASIAGNGFLKSSLVGMLGEYADQISADVIKAIDEMQNRVVTAVEGAASRGAPTGEVLAAL